MNNKTRVGFLLLLGLIWTSINAVRILPYPDKYIFPTGTDNPSAPSPGSTWALWMAFSCVQTSFTYKNPDALSPVVDTLGFLEVFYVTEENGRYLHLWKDDENTTGVLSDHAIDHGWALKSRLLLWNRPLRRADSMLPARAMVIERYDTFALDHSRDFGNFACRQAPDLLADPTDDTVNDGEIYFVYKTFTDSRNRTWMLLATDALIATQAQHESLIGWVPQDRLLLLSDGAWRFPDGYVLNSRVSQRWPEAVADTLNGLGWRWLPLDEHVAVPDTASLGGWAVELPRDCIPGGYHGNDPKVPVLFESRWHDDPAFPAHYELLMGESQRKEAILRLGDLLNSPESCIRKLKEVASRWPSPKPQVEQVLGYFIGIPLPGVFPDTLRVTNLDHFPYADLAHSQDRLEAVRTRLDAVPGICPQLVRTHGESAWWVDRDKLLKED